jgi:hypothetical protein
MKTIAKTALVMMGALFAFDSVAGTSPLSPMEAALRLEARMVEGDGGTIPDPDQAVVRKAGTIDVSVGEWPDPFRDRVGHSVYLAMSQETGNYEFMDEDGTVFWTIVPVLATTENWVAPFRRFSDVASESDALYSPWRLWDVWNVVDSPVEPAEDSGYPRYAQTVSTPRSGSTTNLSFVSFVRTDTHFCFEVAWPEDESLPFDKLDLYVSTNLLSPRWSYLCTFMAQTPPAKLAVPCEAVPGFGTDGHDHGADCFSLTNTLVSPLDGVTTYTNVFWSCSTNRAGSAAFFRIGTRHESDGDGCTDAYEMLVLGTDPENADTDGDGMPDGAKAEKWLSHPLWAENAGKTNLVIILLEPITNGTAALCFNNLSIPLASGKGRWNIGLTPGELVTCRLFSFATPRPKLWCGPPEAVLPDGSPSDTIPEKVASPLWSDRLEDVFYEVPRQKPAPKWPTLRVPLE